MDRFNALGYGVAAGGVITQKAVMKLSAYL
jgi:hypothetical protein